MIDIEIIVMNDLLTLTLKNHFQMKVVLGFSGDALIKIQHAYPYSIAKVI